MKKTPRQYEAELVSTTLHAEAGATLFVCVNWNQASVCLVQLESGSADDARLKLVNERGLEVAFPLPFPAILESAWLEFCSVLRPLLDEGKREWRPVMGGSGSYFRGVLSERGLEIQRAIFEKVATASPGEGVLTPISPDEFLRDHARWDQGKLAYEVPGLGVIGPTPDYPRIAKLADDLPDVAQQQGYVLTDDGHSELLAMAEHAYCEYLDPKNYPAEVQAEARAMEAAAAGEAETDT